MFEFVRIDFFVNFIWVEEPTGYRAKLVGLSGVAATCSILDLAAFSLCGSSSHGYAPFVAWHDPSTFTKQTSGRCSNGYHCCYLGKCKFVGRSLVVAATTSSLDFFMPMHFVNWTVLSSSYSPSYLPQFKAPSTSRWLWY